MNIIIGKHGGENVSIDLATLRSTRLLVTADSGGGKSYLLKLICEQAFGKIQIIVLDLEGEFAPLREKFGFAYIGPGGDAPAHPSSAALLAERLLKFKISAIIDLYEMDEAQRHQFAKNFLNAMVNAPKALWHPVLVIVDEAHELCPESGKGESEASTAMKRLATKGRKRGYIACFATQALANLNKAASGMLMNRLIGPTFEDVNRKRAAEILGVTSKEELRKFYAEMKVLEPGNFYALGRAISKERKLVHIGKIVTAHGDDATTKYSEKPPPPPESLSKLLPQLADLPKAAEEKAKTEAELRREIRELKTQLRSAPAGKAIEVKVADPREIKRVVREVEDEFGRKFSYVAQVNLKTWQDGRRLLKALDEAAKAAARMFPDEAPKFEVPKRKEIPAGEIKKQEELPTTQSSRKSLARTVHTPRPDVSSNGDSDLTPYQLDILSGLAQLEAIGRDNVPLSLAGVAAGKSAKSSTFERYRAKLLRMGLVSYPSVGRIALTDEGRKIAPQVDGLLGSEELHATCLALLTPYQQDLLKALIVEHPDALTREELGEKSGKQSTSSTFERYLAALRGMEMIEYCTGKTVKCADWMFLD